MKYCKPLLNKMLIKIIEETSGGIPERYAIEMETLGIDENHTHLFFGAYPKTSQGEIVVILKSITTR